ncbi:MAG TPA: class I SAM-dependent methyltransferase [bacterium]|nr:class I SAM-dependent methyltransferase [bacterium]
MAHDNARNVRPCPVCGGMGRRQLYRQSFAQMSEGNLLASYDVVVCAECGMGFADHIPEQATFDAYYRDMSKYEDASPQGQPSPDDLVRFRSLADFIQKHLGDRHARIIDVGCGTGGLLAELKQRGYENVAGVDPSETCAERALAWYGIPVLTGSIQNVSVEDGSRDAVIVSGVLEHLTEPGPALQRLSRMLTHRGQVFVVVPDAAHFAEAENAPFQEFSVEHINFFSQFSLVNLMRRSRFREQVVEQLTLPLGYRTTWPAIRAVFQKTDDDLPCDLTQDEETSTSLTRYVELSQQRAEPILATISRLADRATPIIVWSAGLHTLRLLMVSRLGDIQIVVFVDTNPHCQGKLLRSVPIVAPAELKGRTEPILISSRGYQQEIERQIRDELHLDNEVITLY